MTILNENTTRCNSMQSDLFYCRIILHVSGVTAPIIRSSGVPQNFVRSGVQQIQLRTEDRERGYGGGSLLSPSQGFWRQL